MTYVFLLGFALLVAGVALVSPAAALIVAGLLLMGGSWIYSRGADLRARPTPTGGES